MTVTRTTTRPGTGRPVVIDISIREEETEHPLAPEAPAARMSTEQMMEQFRRFRSISASRSEPERVVEVIVNQRGAGSLEHDILKG